jgi:predicted heme/steroid binding protein
MLHDVFGEITFNLGWKAKKTITLFGKVYDISLKIQAYFKEDGITKEQESAYKEYKDAENDKTVVIEKLLKSYSDNAEKQYIPRMLLINRDGSYALLCDDNENPDDGIAVCLSPEEKVVAQDDYL